MEPYESRTEMTAVFAESVSARTIRTIARAIVRGRNPIGGAVVSQPDSGTINLTVIRSHSSSFLAALAAPSVEKAVLLHIGDAGVSLSDVTLTSARIGVPGEAAEVSDETPEAVAS